MKAVMVVAGCSLAAFLAYEWIEISILQSRLDQANAMLTVARRETEVARAALSEQKRQAELAESFEHEKNLGHPPNPSPPIESSHKLSDQKPTSSRGNSEERVGFVNGLLSLAEHAAKLDRLFKSFPKFDIPEIGLLKEADWITIASEHPELETVDQIQRALLSISNKAKFEATNCLREAVQTSWDFTVPGNLNHLIPKLRESMTDAMIERYEFIPAEKLEREWVQMTELRASSDTERPFLVIRERVPTTENQQIVVFFSDDGKTVRSSSAFQIPLNASE
jgi:hypothetical protein